MSLPSPTFFGEFTTVALFPVSDWLSHTLLANAGPCLILACQSNGADLSCGGQGHAEARKRQVNLWIRLQRSTTSTTAWSIRTVIHLVLMPAYTTDRF